MGRTPKVNVAWLAEVLKNKEFMLVCNISGLQCGDIFIKVLSFADRWKQVRALIGQCTSQYTGFSKIGEPQKRGTLLLQRNVQYLWAESLSI